MSILTHPDVQPAASEELRSSAEAMAGAAEVVTECVNALRSIEHTLTGSTAKSVHATAGRLICAAFALADGQGRLDSVEEVWRYAVEEVPAPQEEHEPTVVCHVHRLPGDGELEYEDETNGLPL